MANPYKTVKARHLKRALKDLHWYRTNPKQDGSKWSHRGRYDLFYKRLAYSPAAVMEAAWVAANGAETAMPNSPHSLIRRLEKLTQKLARKGKDVALFHKKSWGGVARAREAKA